MSLLPRSLLSANQPWVRQISSSSRKILNDSRKPILEVAKGSARVEDAPRKLEDENQNRQTPVEFLRHREAMKKRFPDGWNPPRKLSWEAMEGLRTLHRTDPETFSTPVLAERFRISPEAVRRILKSKWKPSKEEKAERLEKGRRRKQEYIAKRIGREREDKWKLLDRLQEQRVARERDKKDGLSLV